MNKESDEIICCYCLLQCDETQHPNLFTYKNSKNDLYMTNCKCNVYMHTHCMEQWIKRKFSCPICLIELKKINNITIAYILQWTLYPFLYLLKQMRFII